MIYSLRDTTRQRNLARNSRVALNFDSHRGAAVVAFTGEATVDETAPPAHANAAYVDKYRADFTRTGSTPEQFSVRYSLPIRVRPTKLRGH